MDFLFTAEGLGLGEIATLNSGGSTGGMKLGGLKDPLYILYNIGAYFP